MNYESWPTEDPRSACSTGSALVITRLSSVAMNIGREVATIATHSGTRRVGRGRGRRVRRAHRTGAGLESGHERLLQEEGIE